MPSPPSANKEVRESACWSHIQRGGTPTAYDRILATRFGVAAVDLIAEGGFGKMVCLRSGRIEAVDIVQAIGQLETVDPNGQMVRAAKGDWHLLRRLSCQGEADAAPTFELVHPERRIKNGARCRAGTSHSVKQRCTCE